MAFTGITMLSLIAGGAGLFSLDRVNSALSRIADKRVPQALALVEVAVQSERILNAAPALLVVTSEASRAKVSKTVRSKVDKLNVTLLQTETGAEIHGESQDSVARLVGKLDRNLLELDALVTQRIKLS